MALAQAAARFGQVGWSGLTAEAQVVLARCAAATWCASLPLAGAAVAYVGSAQFVGVQPTGAGAIPNGYGSGTPLPPVGPTVLPVTGAEGANTTTTPGTVVDGGGAPGYGDTQPLSPETSTTTPVAVPDFPILTMSQEGPKIGNFLGGSPETIERINDVISIGSITTSGGSTKNITQPVGTSQQDDFDRLTQGGSMPRTIETSFGPGLLSILPDRTKIIFRSSSTSTGLPTIEVQRPIGGIASEIRYSQHE